ncbi:uncharacterized protein LOC116348096 [Contarinia nasturtii]|uniref:uncharacterized protein LOC116348096 n=1 Tax=Contarinia nasturtii TaxID=265458 RepID=UPI0012D4511B|nr:uncharacterized protein LOC116348096 [Contarinia nasturtii]
MLRMFLGAIFLTATFGINQCVINNVGLTKERFPSVVYSNNIVGGPLGHHLWRFWSDQANAIEGVLTKTFNCTKINVDDRFLKTEPPKCGKAEWLQDLWAIVRSNDLIAMDLDMIRTVKYMDEQINYMVKPERNVNDKTIKNMVKSNKNLGDKALNCLVKLNQNLNDETVKNLRQILSYGTQFNLPLAKSVFNVYGSQTVYPRVGSDRELSYYGLLHKYENHLKILDSEQLKKLNNLVKTVKPKMVEIYEKVHTISINSNENLKKFHTATFDIFLAMRRIDEGKDIAESLNIISESIEVCKKFMKVPYLKTINSNIDKLKTLIDELVAAQQNLFRDIEEILKVEPKKSKLSFFKLR